MRYRARRRGSTKSKLARGAGDSIKSRTPAEMLGRRPRPGVERSGTPGTVNWNSRARGAGGSPGTRQALSPAPRAGYLWTTNLGFRCAPPQGGVPGRASRLGCETLCCHPLRGLGVCVLEVSEDHQSQFFGRHRPNEASRLRVSLVLILLTGLVVSQASNRGNEEAKGIVVVSAPAAGEIRRVLASEGMEVVEGQPIAEVAVYSPAQSTPPKGPDQKQASAGLSFQAAQAEIEAARSEVVRHEVEVQRLTPLVASGQASPGELDGERALYERSQQRLQKAKTAAQQAQAGLVSARQQSRNSPTSIPTPAEQIIVIPASAKGTVSAINTRIGERVIAGQPLATIRAH